MDFFVNGEKLDITLDKEKTVGDFFASFEKIAAENNGTTVEIAIDGKNIPASDFESACKKELSETKKIELSVVFLENVKAALKEISVESKKISEQIKEVPVKLQAGNDKDANAIIANFSSLIESLCQAATYASLFQGVYNSISVDGKNLSEFFAELQPILRDFEEALQNNDSVLVGDLCEYEISERLQNLSSALKI